MGLQTTRRGFLAAAGGFIVALSLPVRGVRAQAAAALPLVPPNAYVHIGEDDLVTVMVRNIEFGQGPMTGLTTLVAEELDADWSQMRADSAPADPVYSNPLFGMQGTGGSTAVASSYIQMRQVGAMMRQMLVAAAAAEWGVPAEEITVEKGRIKHASGQESGFGAFATAAAQMPAPTEPPALKDPAQFTLIGTDLPKPDTAGKSNGTAMFGMDRYIDGMQTVVIARPQVIGATVASYDDAAAMAVPGVVAVRQLPVGVAVYAQNTYAALKGRAALSVEWDMANAETRDSAQLLTDFTAAAQEPGLDVEAEGDLAALTAEGVTLVEAEYNFPFLAHAPMEPLNGVIELKEGKATAWYGAQFPGGEQPAMAQVLELAPENVVLNVTLAGGSFGRRAQPTMHMAAELAMVAKAAGDGAYKVVWTREDDLQGAYYRPMAVHRLRAGLDGDGKIVGWENVIATSSIMRGTPFEQMMANGLDSTAFEGSNELPYDLGARRVGWVETPVKMPLLWWRSVGSSHTASAVEAFLDEVLAQAGRDPVTARLEMLKEGEDRPRAVIEKVAQMAGWPDGAAEGKALGFAYAKSFGTFVAQIAEVEDRNGFPHVTRVWCAVDCGVAVNPNIIRAQVEGGVGFGLGAALFDEITLGEGGAVQQTNFDNYRMLRIGEMPAVEVEIIASTADPTGIGEPGVPPIAPAVINAWRKLTGQAVRTLPFTRSLNS